MLRMLHGGLLEPADGRFTGAGGCNLGIVIRMEK